MMNTQVFVNTYFPINADQYPEIVRESEKAICFKQGDNNYWIPRKCIVSQGASPLGWFVEIPVWMAKEKGMMLGRPPVPMVY